VGVEDDAQIVVPGEFRTTTNRGPGFRKDVFNTLRQLTTERRPSILDNVLLSWMTSAQKGDSEDVDVPIKRRGGGESEAGFDPTDTDTVELALEELYS
jgi:hypothetical protein